MTCEDVRPRLTAYLDGDLDADRGTVVRGHLRGCEACRRVATDEAALRDGLRAFPTLDPPATLWAGVQARLAAAEVEDAKRPAWRRALARWTPMMPRFAVGGLVATAAVLVLVWRTQRDDAAPVQHVVTENRPTKIASYNPPPPAPPIESVEDVTADLASEPARTTATYADAANDLLELSVSASVQWTRDQKIAFETKVASLHEDIHRAPEGRARQRAWRTLIRYLQGAIVRDEVVLASVGGGPR
jgi:hypothetical protein